MRVFVRHNCFNSEWQHFSSVSRYQHFNQCGKSCAHSVCPALSQQNKSLLLQHRFICSIIHYRNRTHGGGHGNLPAITFARPIGMSIALATSWWWCWSSSVLRIRKPANCITRRGGEQVCKCHASRCTRARTSAHAHVPIGANCLPPIGIDYSA